MEGYRSWDDRTAIDTVEEWSTKRKDDVDDWGDGFYVQQCSICENRFFLKIPFRFQEQCQIHIPTYSLQ